MSSANSAPCSIPASNCAGDSIAVPLRRFSTPTPFKKAEEQATITRRRRKAITSVRKKSGQVNARKHQ